MRFLLSAITSLSVFGAASAPLIIKNNNTNIKNTKSSPFYQEKRISLGGVNKISADQGAKTWELKFTFDLAPGEDISKIRFEGGGLYSYVGWGSDHWEHRFSEISVHPNQGVNVIFDQEHADGLASQRNYLHMTLTTGIKGTNECELWFYYYTKSFNSFTGSWGNLTIGDALVFISE